MSAAFLKSFGILFHYSRLAIFPASLLNSPQEKSGAKECNQSSRQQHDEINDVELRTRTIHVHQTKSAAKMCERKKLGNVANRLGQLFEWRECSRENKHRQQKEN